MSKATYEAAKAQYKKLGVDTRPATIRARPARRRS